MKKFENLGKKLSKEEQKNIMGGLFDGGPNGCSQAGDFCGISSNGYLVKCCPEDPVCVSEKCERGD